MHNVERLKYKEFFQIREKEYRNIYEKINRLINELIYLEQNGDYESKKINNELFLTIPSKYYFLIIGNGGGVSTFEDAPQYGGLWNNFVGNNIADYIYSIKNELMDAILQYQNSQLKIKISTEKNKSKLIDNTTFEITENNEQNISLLSLSKFYWELYKIYILYSILDVENKNDHIIQSKKYRNNAISLFDIQLKREENITNHKKDFVKELIIKKKFTITNLLQKTVKPQYELIIKKEKFAITNVFA